MADESDPHWQFLFICEVLQAPSWEVPVQSFIDENCIVFDNEDENKLAYSELHRDFKELVESLLTQHLAEVGISGDEFYDTCEAAYSAGTSEIGRQIIEQILACEDYLTFKAIMFERNKELEFEVLNAFTVDDEEISQALQQSSTEAKEQEFLELEEKYDLETALERSLHDQKLVALEKEEAEMQKAIAMSLVLEEERSRLVSANDTESKVPDGSAESKDEESNMESKFDKPSKLSLGARPLPPISSSSFISERREEVETYLGEMTSHKGKVLHGELDSKEIDKYELMRRSKHLKAQREKLLKKKTRERQAKLKAFEKQRRDHPQTVPQQQIKQKHKPEQGHLTCALARRMKYELINEASNDRQGMSNVEGQSNMSLDDKLKAVEELRQKKYNLLQGN